MMKTLPSVDDTLFDQIVAIRRDLHMHPEVGFDLHRTAGLVADRLTSLGVEVRTGIGKIGVVGDIRVDGAQKTVALRADMDALPMDELGTPPYKSTVAGAAHMCGHDAHTAMLLGAAELLMRNRDQLTANVRLIFQPCEERLPGGAPGMIADGVLEGVDAIYGLHVNPWIAAGRVGFCPGPFMAQADLVDIDIFGQGGHAARPDQCIDPIVMGAQMVNALQTLVSRRVPAIQPAVVSVTQFHAGTAHNVISDRATLQATVRTFDRKVQALLKREISQICEAVAASCGGRCEVRYTDGYPALVNDAQACERVWQAIEEAMGADVPVKIDPIMGGEDFAYYLQQVPGCFLTIGCRNEHRGIVHSLHDPRFDIDESCMRVGIQLHLLMAGLA